MSLKAQVLEALDNADQHGQPVHTMEVMERLGVCSGDVAIVFGELLDEGVVETVDGTNFTLRGR